LVDLLSYFAGRGREPEAYFRLIKIRAEQVVELRWPLLTPSEKTPAAQEIIGP